MCRSFFFPHLIFTGLCLLLLVALPACIATPTKVTVKQDNDHMLSCPQIEQEMAQAQRYKEEARKEDRFRLRYIGLITGIASAYNINKAESNAIKRIEHLQQLHAQKYCGQQTEAEQASPYTMPGMTPGQQPMQQQPYPMPGQQQPYPMPMPGGMPPSPTANGAPPMAPTGGMPGMFDDDFFAPTPSMGNNSATGGFMAPPPAQGYAPPPSSPSPMPAPTAPYAPNMFDDPRLAPKPLPTPAPIQPPLSSSQTYERKAPVNQPTEMERQQFIVPQ